MSVVLWPDASSTRGPAFAPGLAVSLFSGAGGLDLGLQSAGWSVLAQIEMNADCVSSLEQQAKRAKSKPRCLSARLEDIDPRWLRKSLGLRPGALGLLAGGPPCQPFTTTGLRQGINDRRASSAFPAYLRYVSEFLPESLLIENVDGMLSAALKHRPLDQRGRSAPRLDREEQKGAFLHWLLTELANLGYAVSWGVVEAADHGVPQFRQRAVLIGVRGRTPCFLPPASYGPLIGRPYKTVRDALARLKDLGPIQPLSERKRNVFSLVPPGGNWRSLPVSVRRETMGAAFYATGGKSGWWRRLSWDSPAPTILGMPDHSSTALVHPDEVRCMSLNECAALQTFPAEVRFAGSARSAYQQVGNAVPPRLARVLGRHVAKHLAGERLPTPAAPPWRHESANRRIGSHGYVVPSDHGPVFSLLAKPREDSVWAVEDDPRLF